jgi:DNA invertase Pin-like site-specific DNA recombinase
MEGTSLESQQAACSEYTKSKNIDILKVFIEQGESAKFADRTQLLELIEFCRKNKGSVDALLVWKVDRFARNVADHFSVKSTLAKLGVRIISVTEPIDNNPEGNLMETILAGFAEFDNSVRAMRTVQGMRRRIQDGIFPWRPPLGYKSSVSGTEKKNAPDLPDEPSFSLVRRAFQEFATGAYTKAEIGRLMSRWGLVTVRGKALAPQSLDELFNNPFYMGTLVDPWSGEEHPGKHTPVVTRAEFTRVQQVISARRRAVPHRKEREEFPLRGIVRCEACRHQLTAAFSRGRSNSYPYYLCSQKQCARRGKSVPAAKVHDEFTSFLDEIAPRPELIDEIAERVIKIAEEDKQSRSHQQRRRRKTIGQLEAQVNELIRMRAQQLLTNEEFLRQKQGLMAQRMALEAHSNEIIDVPQIRADMQRITKPLTALRATWEALNPRLRLRFDHLVLPGGFSIGKIRTADLGLLFSTLRASVPMESGEVHLACASSNRIISEIDEFARILKDVEWSEDELLVAVR